MKSQPVSILKEFKEQMTLPEGVCRSKQRKNFDEPISDESTELHDDDGYNLDKDVEENNGSDEETDLDNPEEQPDQPRTVK